MKELESLAGRAERRNSGGRHREFMTLLYQHSAL